MNAPTPAARIAQHLNMSTADIEQWLNNDMDNGRQIDDDIRARLAIADDEHPLVELHARGILTTTELEELSE